MAALAAGKLGSAGKALVPQLRKLVEDERTLQKSVTRHLQSSVREEVGVELAASAEDAMQILETASQAPSSSPGLENWLLLMDHGLPRMSGSELA